MTGRIRLVECNYLAVTQLLKRREFLQAAGLTGTAVSLGIKKGAMFEEPITIFIGTYTADTDSKGIYAMQFDPVSGSMTMQGCVFECENPSYLLVDEGTHTLYAVEETLGGSNRNGRVHSFRICRTTHKLTHLSSAGTEGIGPCFLSLDRRRRTLFVANYHSGTILSLAIQRDGSIGPRISKIALTGSGKHPVRQSSPHPHAIVSSPDNLCIIVADLGTDQLLIFGFNEKTGEIIKTPVSTVKFDPESGPRHLCIHPSQKFLYVIHEISSEVTVHHLGGEHIVGSAIQKISSTGLSSDHPLDASDLAIDVAGRMLYAATRQNNHLRSFAVERSSGRINAVSDTGSCGESPQAIVTTPDSPWLIAANLKSGNLSIFRRLIAGHLKFSHRVSVPSPSSIAFVRLGGL